MGQNPGQTGQQDQQPRDEWGEPGLVQPELSIGRGVGGGGRD